MGDTETYVSGKTHSDENFPVASHLIHPQHRPVVLAFYRFARRADDVADHSSATPSEKLARLAEVQACLLGEQDLDPDTVILRGLLAERKITRQHALDLLTAFRLDVTKLRYSDWSDLMDYCRYSASPVGRFMLDVHGESEYLWPASDALCNALQVINHLQDCAKDYRALNRVYIPLDVLAAEGLTVEALRDTVAVPALRRVLAGLVRRTGLLLDQSEKFAGNIRDARLAFEVASIQGLARSLTGRLLVRDPLSECVHHRSHEALGVALLAIARLAPSRFYRLFRGAK